MKLAQVLEISNCRECPYYTNSSRLHDCAFTSAPYPTREYCQHPKWGGRYNLLLNDVFKEFSPDCPVAD